MPILPLMAFPLNKSTVTNKDYCTHLSFIGGKYYVSPESFDDFYKEYYKSLTSGKKLYLVEKVNKGDFLFFLDLEFPKTSEIRLTDTDVKSIIKPFTDLISQDFVISKRESNYHVNFYNHKVNCQGAMQLIDEAKSDIPQHLFTTIDTSVYKTGLRMLGSMKKHDSGIQPDSIYRIYNLDTGSFLQNNFDTFMKCCILRKEFILNPNEIPDEIGNKTETRINTPEIYTLFNEICTSVDFLPSDTSLMRISEETMPSGLHRYILTPSHNYCPFKKREHKRQSNPVYITVGINGVEIKCYDSDCSRRSLKVFDDKIFTKYPSIKEHLADLIRKTSGLSDNQINILHESLRFTHYSIATAFFNLYKDTFRVDEAKSPTWYKFTGNRWEKTASVNITISEDFVNLYKKLLNIEMCTDEHINVQCISEIIKKLENSSYKASIIQQLIFMYNDYDPEFVNKLDSNPMLVGFNNGIYDFNQMVFRRGNPFDYITFTTKYDYHTDNATDDIISMITKILPDKEIRSYVLKTLAKTLVGKPDEKFHVFTGISGANGKSTIVSLMENTLGDYASAIDISLLTTHRKNPSNANPDVCRLKGKRFFAFQEPESNDKLNTGILKQFSGGDTIIARDLYKSPISFVLQGSMFLCCNDTPDIQSADGGTWRRIKVVEFNSRFVSKPNPCKQNEFLADYDLKYKIKLWNNKFMNLLLHYYKLYLSEGITEPVEVNIATDLYKSENNVFMSFIDAYCVEDKNTFTTVQEIYCKFSFWWMENNPNTKTPPLKELKKALKTKYGREKSCILDGIPSRGFYVSLR
jgi:P4 family phage/plasmid primase-like protien